MTVLSIPHSLQGNQSKTYYFESQTFQVCRSRLNIFEQNYSFLSSINIPGFSKYLWMQVNGLVEGKPGFVEVCYTCSTTATSGGGFVCVDDLSVDERIFLSYSLAKSINSFQSLVSVIKISDSWIVRTTSATSFLITHWGDDFLKQQSLPCIEPTQWITSTMRLSNEFSSLDNLADLLACICIHHKEVIERVPPDVRYVPSLLWEWLAAGKDALKDEFEAFVWMGIIDDDSSVENSKRLTDMINGPSLPRDHSWSVHRRLEVAMRRGTMTEIISIIQTGKLPRPDRLKVYAFILGLESNAPTAPTDLKPARDGALDARFKSLVALHRCGFKNVVTQFRHRIVLHSREDRIELLRQFLSVMDPPLLGIIDRMTFDVHCIIEDVFACTSLCDEDLVMLWDVLMVSPPDTLIKVLVFVLIELRELIIQDLENMGNVLLCVGDLVENFPQLVKIAICESILD